MEANKIASKVGVTLLLFTNVILNAAVNNTSLFDAERLLNDKQSTYTQRTRPKINFTEPVVIFGSFEIVALRDFDAVSEKLSIIGAITLQWKDDRMTWNESDYNGLQSISVESDLFWTPFFILGNSFDEFKKIGEKPYWPVRYQSDGTAMFSPGDVFTCNCPTDVTYYPWDSQSCTLVFVAYGAKSDEIQVLPKTTKVEVSYYGGHGEWDVKDTVIRSEYNNLSLTVRLDLQRKPTFIVLNVILPIIFLSFMGSFVFCIPTESGERILYGMTVLLAMSVFLTIISQTLPSSAENIAILCYYIVAVIALNVVIILGVIFNMNIYFRENTRVVSKSWVRILNCFRCRKHGNNSNDTGQIKRVGKEFRKPKENDVLGVNLRVHNGEILPDNGVNRGEMQITEDEAKACMEQRSKRKSERPKDYENNDNSKDMKWKDVSCFLDSIFFTVSLLGTLMLTSLVFCYVIFKAVR